jgi:hypothetical protein
MSYKPQNITEQGERLMSYKPLNPVTQESNQYERPRVSSTTTSVGGDKLSEEKLERPTTALTSDLSDRKLRFAADSNFQSREEPKTTSQNLELSEAMGGKIGNIDQMRDILFGGQMRDYEKRFKRLEERFTQESMHVRDDIIQRLRVLEERVNGEVESLAEKAKIDRQERLLAQQDFRQELSALKNELNTRLTQLDEQIAKEIKNFRQQTHSKFQELAMQLRQQNETLTTLITQEVAQLHEEKVNRSDLAAFFNELAVRLSRNLERTADGG